MKEVIHKLHYILFLFLILFVQMSFALTAKVYIENIRIIGNQLLWEIHFLPVSGWTGGSLNANSYLLSASWYFKYNSLALNTPVLIYQNPIIQGHYLNSTGITGGRVYVSTTDMGDPQQVTQGTKYHLYTVSMTILNFSAISDPEWDELNTAIENFSGSVAAGSDLEMIPPWAADLTVTGSNTLQTRTFGGNSHASNGFDSVLDIIATAPALDYYSYFTLPTFPNYLIKDIRHWASPYMEELSWELDLVNADQVTSTVTWDPSQFPSKGSFTLRGAGTMDMRTSSSVSFNGNKTLIVSYSPYISMTYTFGQTGWYLVSLPVIPEDSTVSMLFPQALGGHAFIWNQAISTYETVTKMQPRKGYWLAIPAASSSEVTGLALNEYTEHFSMPGWYMVGSIAGGADFVNPNDNPDESVLNSAFGWDTQAGMYVQTTTLNGKEGYWVAVFNACDLTVAGTAGELSKLAAGTNTIAFHQKHGSEPPGPPNIDWNTGKIVEIPKEFDLSQNFPNPFNESTVIEIALPKQCHVELIIMDILGREVYRLLNNTMNPGNHQILWNGMNDQGRKVSSGIYLYTLRTKGYYKMRKLLVIK